LSTQYVQPEYSSFTRLSAEHVSLLHSRLDLSRLRIATSASRVLGDELMVERELFEQGSSSSRQTEIENEFADYQSSYAQWVKSPPAREPSAWSNVMIGAAACGLLAAIAWPLVAPGKTNAAGERQGFKNPQDKKIWVDIWKVTGVTFLLGCFGWRKVKEDPPRQPSVARKYSDSEILARIAELNRKAFLEAELRQLPNR